MKEESSLGKRDKGGGGGGSALARQCTAAQSPSKRLHPAPTEFKGFQENSTDSMLNNPKKLKIHSELPRLTRGWATTLMIPSCLSCVLPTLCLASLFNTSAAFSWIMLRSNFASDFPNISFCKSLSVGICLFTHGLLFPSFTSGLSCLWPSVPCRFSGHSSFGTSFLLTCPSLAY